jgi:uncharacterized lipoprotein NlpE involved in copper resistance
MDVPADHEGDAMGSWNMGRAPLRAGVVGIAVIALFAGCGPRQKSEGAGEAAPPSEPPADAQTPAAPAILGIYEGTLPCADCGGIQTELTLYADGARYALKQTYLATKDGDRTVESAGSWTTERGHDGDANAVVYVIDPGDPANTRRFLVTSDRTIELLDKDGKRITSAANHTLSRKDAMS